MAPRPWPTRSSWARSSGCWATRAGKVTMSSTKSATGHLLGAAGAIEAIFSILAIRDQVAPPTINLDNPAVEARVDLAPNAKRERKIDVALSNSFGFGGTNASARLRQGRADVAPHRLERADASGRAAVPAGGRDRLGRSAVQRAGPAGRRRSACRSSAGSNMRAGGARPGGRGRDVVSARSSGSGRITPTRPRQLKAGSFLVPERRVDGRDRRYRHPRRRQHLRHRGRLPDRRAARPRCRCASSTRRPAASSSWPSSTRPTDAAPAEYCGVRDEADTRYRIALAEGVTSWQVVEALKASRHCWPARWPRRAGRGHAGARQL